ncbi:uncharacterized protein LOC118751837, partial [Rhagoletis pomonella]|uniref:uncharacterized protein LOC118751837 n=1 Tax=Rhagoletis pomonella TaxID=28610 RepID=UPI00178104FC
ITTYEIPPGHSNYGPPSKPPTYSSATHQYLPPATGGYSGGGAPFSSGHAAFEAPASNYLPTGYANEGNDDFNIYGRHQKLSEADTRKAAAQLQEILSLLPNGKTEFTASKTVVLDTHSHSPHTGPGAELTNESADLHTYGLQNDLGPLESLSHTESITAAYGQRPGNGPENPADIYRQMAKKQTAEEIYIQKHPNEGYDYRPTNPPAASNGNQGGGYHYNNYHATSSALKDLTPIIAALEVAKRRGATQANVSKHFAVEKSVYKVDPRTAAKSSNQQFKYLPPSVQKTKHIYFDPAQNKADNEYRPTYVPPPPPSPPQPPQRPQAIASGSAPSAAVAAPSHTYAAQQHSVAYAAQQAPSLTVQHAPAASSSSASSSSSSSAYKVRRQVPSGSSITALKVQSKLGPYFKHHDYEINDPLMFNRMLLF